MKPEIKNGILIAGNERIVLAHVQKWKIDGSTVVFFMAGTQISLNVGAEASALDICLTAHFTNPVIRHAAPFKNLTEEQVKFLLQAGTITRISPEQLA